MDNRFHKETSNFKFSFVGLDQQRSVIIYKFDMELESQSQIPP